MTSLHFRPSKKILNSSIYKATKEVCCIFQENGYDSYLVGGAVRDFILFPKLIPKDLDIATNATVAQIESLFPNSTLVGKSFGVCIIKYKKFSFEIATFRKDGAYLDRRHPSTVSAGTLIEDSQRRDFTINALYFSPIYETIIDLHAGINDIKKKIIRCVGEADNRIYEDALRILRCIRFSSNFKFKIEKSLLLSIKKHQDGLKNIPMERILDELSKVCARYRFVENFYGLVDISLFFQSMKKLPLSSRGLIAKSTLTQKDLNHFKFSQQSNFFDFFVMFLKFYEIDDFNELNIELKRMPSTNYDTKLCLWFLNILKIGREKSEISPLKFFKELISIERIEKKPNKKIFSILKKLITNRIYSQIITKYLKNKNKFSQSAVIKKLRTQNILETEFSTLILQEYYQEICKR